MRALQNPEFCMHTFPLDAAFLKMNVYGTHLQ